MPELRWILLLVGVGVIAGIYLWHRRSTSAPEYSEPLASGRTEPGIAEHTLSDQGSDRVSKRVPTEPASEPHLSEPLVVIPEAAPDEPVANPAPVANEPEPQVQSLDLELPEPAVESVPQKQKIISLRIATRANDQLHGVEVVNALKQCGLEHGQYKIFHRFSNGDQRELMFSVASLVEPGSFILDALEDMSLPGLSVFMILPGPADAVSAFSEMLAVSRRLAEKLNCELLDDTGSTLSAQAASYLREDIIKFQHQLGPKH